MFHFTRLYLGFCMMVCIKLFTFNFVLSSSMGTLASFYTKLWTLQCTKKPGMR